MNSLVKLMIVLSFTLGVYVPAVHATDDNFAQLAAVKANRAEVIAGIVADWMPTAQQNGLNLSAWAQEFQVALEAAPDAHLLAIQTAADYDAVLAILQYRSVPANVDGLSIQEIGDLAEDLTFTPLNPPCRIVDTRNIGSAIPASTTKSYFVHGSSGLMTPQGGNSAGCTSPKGEPVGAVINLAAVSPLAAGHLRMWPYGYTMPTVSYLNFSAGQNIANAGIISSAYMQGYDISIYNGSTTHYIADVMGYFYPAEQAVPSLDTSTSYLSIGTSCTNHSGAAVTITVPGPGYITVTAQVMLFMTGLPSNPQYAYVFIGTSTADCTSINSAQGYAAPRIQEIPFSGNKYITVPVSRTFYVTSEGTYTYYVNGTASSSSSYFIQTAMQAHYVAN